MSSTTKHIDHLLTGFPWRSVKLSGEISYLSAQLKSDGRVEEKAIGYLDELFKMNGDRVIDVELKIFPTNNGRRVSVRVLNTDLQSPYDD
jgi:hypothetical protein